MISSTPTPAVPLWLRIARNPILRIIAFIVMLVVLSKLMSLLIPPRGLTPEQRLQVTGSDLWLGALRSLLPMSLAYWLLVRGIEGRKIAELAPRKLVPHVGIGWLVGMGIMVVAAGLMAAFGAYRIHGINEGVNLLTPLVVLAVLPGITEEILFRGVLFRVVEDGLGTWIAIGFSGLLFGAAHLANPNATWWSSLAIAIEAGLLLGMAFAWTRSLWFCMGLHAAWNFTQGPLLGIPVSGIELKGWLNASTQGPLLISGGEFGAEASLLTVILCVSLAAFFTRKAIAGGNIRPPFWRRPRAIAVSESVEDPAAAPTPNAD